MKTPHFFAALVVSAVTAFAADSTVVFNEIRYHPANELTQTEWVELRSLQAVDVDIGAWRIEGGIDYTFPNGTVMPGLGYLVIAAAPGQIAGALGPFTGQLDNGGETIRLVNRNGRVMDELSYDDEGDWPLAPDGSGATLARTSASAASGAQMWSGSAAIGGTPGAANAALPAATLVFSEISDAADAGFFIEVQNKSAGSVSTGGWIVTTSTGVNAALPARSVAGGGYASFTAASLSLTPADGMKLFLFAPGGTECRDARAITNRLRGLTGEGRWGYPDSATPGAANVVTVSDAIVINEIFHHGLNGSAEQWIELTNKSGAPVNVGGWKFADGVSYTIPVATPAIPQGGFLVVAWDTAAFAALHPGVTALGPFSGSLSGRGETITLRDANDNVADEVTYSDGGRWSAWADGGGSSLELRDARADNSKGEAWDASDESSHSSWVTVGSGTYQGLATNPNADNPTNYNEFVFGLLDAGEFLIDDFSVKDVTLGNVELIQNGGFESGAATGWRIIGTHAGSVITDPTTGSGKVLKVSASGATEHMHNHAETTLKNGASYVAIDATHTYNITFRAKWLRGANRLHTRLWHNRLVRQTLLNMPVTGGTPGAVNGRALANIGPTFDVLAHSPVIPAASQAATVTVKIADPDGIGSVQLFYSVNGAAFLNPAMTTTGGGIYTGTVPGQAGSALVQFYVQATDALGAVSYFPAAGAASRAMIPWQDGRAQLTLASGAKPHNVRVVIPTEDATELYKPENLMSDAAIPGTVILDESEVYYRAGIRLKSSEHGRIVDTRCGYTLEFPSDNLFMGLHDTVAIDRSGGTSAGQKEILLRRLSNTAGGIYTPEDDICRVISAVGTLPTSQYFTGAALTSAAIMSKTRLDREYLDSQFPNGGDGSMNKYERIYVSTSTISPSTRAITAINTGNVLTSVAEDPKVPQSSPGPNAGVLVTSLGADKETYRWYWLLQNGRESDDFTGIINLTNAVGQTGGSASFNTLAAQYINVSAWLRAVVPATLYGVTDNYLGTGSGKHNTLVYFPPGQKALLMPWDLDFLAQSNPTTTSLTTGGDVAKFIANPVWKRLYYGHMLDILNRSFNTTYMTTWATHYSRFGTDDMVPSVSAYLTPRASHAMSQVSAAIPSVAFTRTSASPVTVSTPFATVSGDGWVNVAEIRLQGSAQDLAVTWTDENSWTLQLPVSAGTAIYTLIAYDNNGASLGTASVTITGSGGIFPAGPENLVVSELNYNPAGGTDATEFIEMLNITGATLDLGGCHFDEELGQGIAYTFSAGVQVAPGARIVIARNRTAFLAAYPASAAQLAAGQYDPTGFDNGGEMLVLYAASGLEIFRFTYSDSITSTDGGGRTLVRLLSSTSPNPSTYLWRESMQTNGNPGTSDAITFAGSPLADVDGDGIPAIIEYACGSSDNNAASRPAQPQFVFNVNGTVAVTYPTVVNADDVICTVETTTTLGSGWVPVTGPITSGGNRSFRLSVTLR